MNSHEKIIGAHQALQNNDLATARTLIADAENEISKLPEPNLRKTRDLLLPKLISGELDVSEMEI